ncbi:MAG TPA: hypothetical protein VLJ11_09740 [Bryobacteraceae bacterium]|nr:hypothetical protein [Bryobacteraceae bacterium]
MSINSLRNLVADLAASTGALAVVGPELQSRGLGKANPSRVASSYRSYPSGDRYKRRHGGSSPEQSKALSTEKQGQQAIGFR